MATPRPLSGAHTAPNPPGAPDDPQPGGAPGSTTAHPGGCGQTGCQQTSGSRRTPGSTRGRVALLVAVVTVLGIVVVPGSGDSRTAWAVVGHHQGFHATVYGWTSWYGSYDMGPLGVGWCIDHGLRAPDPAFAYVPTPVEGTDERVRRAVAWIASAPPSGPAQVDAAGRMLAIHDLMGAVYPFGRLDVDRLTTSHLAGFAGQEPAVLARARAVKAEATGLSHLRPPIRLQVEVEDVAPGAEGRIAVAVTDVDGQAVPGVGVQLRTEGLHLHGSPDAATIGDGRARWRFVRSGTPEEPLPLAVAATAEVPSLDLRAFASSSVPAQRVALTTIDELEDSVELDAPPPPTTVPPTTAPPTTLPPTTTSSTSTSTTAPPPTSTTSTTSPSTTSTTAPPDTSAPPTVPPTTNPPAPPPPSGPPPPPPGRGTLPRTGPTATVGLAMTGAGLVLTGTALRLGTRRRGSHRHFGGGGGAR